MSAVGDLRAGDIEQPQLSKRSQVPQGRVFDCRIPEIKLRQIGQRRQVGEGIRLQLLVTTQTGIATALDITISSPDNIVLKSQNAAVLPVADQYSLLLYASSSSACNLGRSNSGICT